MEICEFCGKEVEDTQGTSMTGAYCIDCLQLTISECKSAIKQLKERQREKPKPKDDSSIEEKYGNALANLLHGPG